MVRSVRYAYNLAKQLNAGREIKKCSGKQRIIFYYSGHCSEWWLSNIIAKFEKELFNFMTYDNIWSSEY